MIKWNTNKDVFEYGEWYVTFYEYRSTNDIILRAGSEDTSTYLFVI